MRLRRFEGATVAEALAQVRAVLGPEAVILHTRAADTGTAERRVEVTAAVDGAPAALRPVPRAPRPAAAADAMPEAARAVPPDDRLEDMYRLLLDLREGPGLERMANPVVRELHRHELPAGVVRRLLHGAAGGHRRVSISRPALHAC
jgi:hypothetical protein